MNSKVYLSDRIVGTWKLVSWTYVDGAGNSVDFFGEGSSGILMYDHHGYMNAQLMRLPRREMSVQRLFEGAPDEISEAYQTYAAYYGRYKEERPGEFVHTVEGSLFPNWTGKEEIRFAKIEGEFLTLSAPPVEIDGKEVIFDVLWRRVVGVGGLL